jgi:Protein of unknown function (DUF1194)
MLENLRTLRAVAMALGLATISAAPASAQSRQGVDLELVLAVDVSGSMDPEEQDVQRKGYIEAFRTGAIANAVRSGSFGRIAVTYVEWAANPQQTVPWTIIANAKDAEAFAAALEARPIYSERGTSISAALTFSSELFDANAYEGARKVIDISGDGVNNAGIMEGVREAVVAKKIIINGLPVLMNTATDLEQYYRNCVIGGPGAFVIPVTSVERFSGSIRAKLVSEIAGLAPRPGPGAAKFQFAQLSQTPKYDCRAAERGGGYGRFNGVAPPEFRQLPEIGRPPGR